LFCSNTHTHTEKESERKRKREREEKTGKEEKKNVARYGNK